eukprot:CAMPEP_0174386196 /NCGR_PEP_ID=MMETSP0811_2-20130205/127116_1 /TAXON_ID=73025 ORGANISM="Eutreptiella gymnastica-like, Strain CCMP1594" /NCGR_SAMPLE_ID=MMETSP0811_2 /ASSEMBLY_ACC=CAM_ASM_000667 /LENGTH=63 /DNA_ID=CAMNT_0015540787 /DNA_START=190 /DNA_END=381 /DNA_ORIENTATION=+
MALRESRVEESARLRALPCLPTSLPPHHWPFGSAPEIRLQETQSPLPLGTITFLMVEGTAAVP